MPASRVPALRAGRRRTRCGRCSASSRGRAGRSPGGAAARRRRGRADADGRRAGREDAGAARRRRGGGRPAAAAVVEHATSDDDEEDDGVLHADSILAEDRDAAPGNRDGDRVAWACFLRWYEPDQVRRVCGLATLSALSRSPEAVFSCGDRSTDPTRSRGADRSPQPGDHVVDDLAALGLVVGLVAEPRVGPPGRRPAAPASGSLADGGTSRPPRRGSRASGPTAAPTAARTRACSASASAPKRTWSSRARSAGPRGTARRPPGRATGRPPSKSFGIVIVGATRPSTRATARFQPGTVESMRGRAQDERIGQGPGGSATA